MPVYHPLDLALTPATYAQCRLDFISTSIVRLGRYRGLLLTIDGVPQQIPAAGVDLAPTGLVVGTSYYVYAYMNAGVMTLEASTTGQAVDPRNGMLVKSGDATRTVVGMAYANTGPAFVFSGNILGVCSWYNKLRNTYSASINGVQTSSTTNVGLAEAYAVVLGGDILYAGYHGYGHVATIGGGSYTGVQRTLWPGGTPTQLVGGGESTFTAAAANYAYPISFGGLPFAGLNQLTRLQCYARMSSGTGTWQGVFWMDYVY